jgi:lysophospholipase L1-like esterase
MIKNFKWLVLVALTFVACTNEDEIITEEPISSGTADFSKYVALGDSFAAGYSDNALFPKGQENSYPNIVAQQFATAGGGVFSTPWMSNDNIGGFSLGGNQVVSSRLYFNGSAPVNVTGVTSTLLTDRLTGSYSNMGIPGAKSYHLGFAGYGALNPYFGRIASTPTATVIADAVAQNPTFFSLWIGGNDVLGYATSGGIGVNQTGNFNPATYGNNDITDPNVYASTLNTLVTNLTANGAKGVMANLPYVNSLPYFTTVPFNAVPLSAATAGQLNSGYAQYNGGLALAQSYGLITAAEKTRRTITFQAGQNAVVMVDSYLTNLSSLGLPSYRQATAEDLLVLPSRSVIGTTVNGNPAQVNGVSVPLADQWVLSKDEIAEVKIATDAYNVTIESIANAKGLAFVDTKTVMNNLLNGGEVFDAYTMTTTYVTGGAFSLDGVHPGARGYALIANKFIEAINAKYGSTMKKVKAADYRILYPAAF